MISADSLTAAQLPSLRVSLPGLPTSEPTIQRVVTVGDAMHLETLIGTNPRTTTSRMTAGSLILAADSTSYGAVLPPVTDGSVTAARLLAVRKMTGLTWSQLAGILGVDRRSVHNWAVGGRMSSGHEEALSRLSDLSHRLFHGDPAATRHELFAHIPPATPPAARPSTGKPRSVLSQTRSRADDQLHPVDFLPPLSD